MCLLLVAVDVVRDHPVVVLANRDEYWDRPTEAPAVRADRDPVVSCGLDLRAGGTWLGINGEGVLVGLTNRPGSLRADRPSRGEVTALALSGASAREGMDRALAWAAGNGPNPFSLFVADRHSALAATYDGPPQEPVRRELGSGLHTVSNLHDVNELSPQTVLAAGPDGPLEMPAGLALPDAVMRLEVLAKSHAPLDGTRTAICVHDDANRRGTRSSAVLAIDAAGAPALFRSAWGPPCTTPFEPVALPQSR
jgi:uncharacterized protein with NRDE domain